MKEYKKMIAEKYDKLMEKFIELVDMLDSHFNLSYHEFELEEAPCLFDRYRDDEIKMSVGGDFLNIPYDISEIQTDIYLWTSDLYGEAEELFPDLCFEYRVYFCNHGNFSITLETYDPSLNTKQNMTQFANSLWASLSGSPILNDSRD